MEYVCPTKMDPISYAILTDSNFDYSKLTWDDMVTMVEFWAFRFADPLNVCKVWITLCTENMNRDLWQKTCNAICGSRYDPTTNKTTYHSEFKYIFQTRKGQESKAKSPLEDFDMKKQERCTEFSSIIDVYIDRNFIFDKP